MNRIRGLSSAGAFTRLRIHGTPDPAVWLAASGALAFLVAVVYIPQLSRMFHFDSLHPVDVLVSLAAGAAGIVWTEFCRHISRRRSCAVTNGEPERR